jgi:hypothetical protein
MNTYNTRKTISIDINTPPSLKEEFQTDRENKQSTARQGDTSTKNAIQVRGGVRISNVFVKDLSRESS